MRVLLIRHKTTWAYPVMGSGIGIVGTALAQAGHAVQVIDNNSFYRYYSDAELVRSARQARPHLIGMSISLHNAAVSYALARELRRALPEVWLLAGGIHMRHCAPEALRNCFDFVVEREAERVVVPLLAAIEQAGPERARQELAGIAGIAYARPDGSLRRAAAYPRVEHLDEVPHIDYDLFNLSDFLKLGAEPGVIRVGGQRGCPFSCTFCSDPVQRRDRRATTPDHLFETVRALRRSYGVSYFVIEDNNFTLPRERALAFCQRIARSSLRGQVSFACYTNLRAPLDDELLQALREAGFIKVGLGVERLDPDALRSIDKLHTPEDARQALQRLRRFDLGATVAILLGFPFERAARLRREREAFRGLLPWTHRFDVSVLAPTPGTVFYDEHPELRGWYLDPPWGGARGAYHAHVTDDLTRLMAQRNLFGLDAAACAELRSFMEEFLGHTERYYQEHKTWLYRALRRGDLAVAAASRVMAQRAPSVEEALFGPVRYARHYLGTARYGGSVADFR